ncbi:hypothetical protein J6590_058343 [Homalodisca vitripennis]|nr:hypothetical protein J6590_058343 [Homalodisca vitripennis]
MFDDLPSINSGRILCLIPRLNVFLVDGSQSATLHQCLRCVRAKDWGHQCRNPGVVIEEILLMRGGLATREERGEGPLPPQGVPTVPLAITNTDSNAANLGAAQRRTAPCCVDPDRTKERYLECRQLRTGGTSGRAVAKSCTVHGAATPPCFPALPSGDWPG